MISGYTHDIPDTQGICCKQISLESCVISIAAGKGQNGFIPTIDQHMGYRYRRHERLSRWGIGNHKSI
jgi:hypothetical protein